MFVSPVITSMNSSAVRRMEQEKIQIKNHQKTKNRNIFNSLPSKSTVPVVGEHSARQCRKEWKE